MEVIENMGNHSNIFLGQITTTWLNSKMMVILNKEALVLIRILTKEVQASIIIR